MNIVHVEKLTEQPWLNLFATHYENRGKPGRWIFVSRHDQPYGPLVTDAVVIVPIWRPKNGPARLVMIREYRVPVGNYLLGLPAGLVEKGEPVEEAICREMREETGFRVKSIQQVTQPLFSSSGLTDESAALAFIEVEDDDSQPPAPDHGEEIEVVTLDWEGVDRVCRDRSLLVDVKAWAILLMFQRLGKID